MTKVSWALLQDSFYTDISLRCSSNTIATGVLYLAVHCCELDVPSGGHSRPWWSVFSPRASEKELQQIACEIMSIRFCSAIEKE